LLDHFVARSILQTTAAGLLTASAKTNLSCHHYTAACCSR